MTCMMKVKASQHARFSADSIITLRCRQEGEALKIISGERTEEPNKRKSRSHVREYGSMRDWNDTQNLH